MKNYEMYKKMGRYDHTQEKKQATHAAYESEQMSCITEKNFDIVIKTCSQN